MAILSSGRIKLFLGSSVSYESMLAQWKSDGFTTCKCLDRNKDMCHFFGHRAILSSRKIKSSLRFHVLYQSMLAHWKSDGFITCKSLDRNEDMYDFFAHMAVVVALWAGLVT